MYSQRGFNAVIAIVKRLNLCSFRVHAFECSTLIADVTKYCSPLIWSKRLSELHTALIHISPSLYMVPLGLLLGPPKNAGLWSLLFTATTREIQQKTIPPPFISVFRVRSARPAAASAFLNNELGLATAVHQHG
jgi:hypothetical protein